MLQYIYNNIIVTISIITIITIIIVIIIIVTNVAVLNFLSARVLHPCTLLSFCLF